MSLADTLNEVLKDQGEKAAVKKFLEVLGEHDVSMKSIQKTIETLTSKGEAWEGLDPKAISEGLEATKSAIDEMRAAIRNGDLLGHAAVPGLGDYSKKFSMARMCNAISSGNWEGAGFEKEVIDAVKAKSQNISLPDQGGYFVPFQVIDDVIGVLYARSVLISVDGEGNPTRVNVVDGLTGQQVNVPKFKGGVAAYWQGEEDEYAESMATVGNVSMSPKKLGILVRMSDEMRNFPNMGFENLLRRDMGKAIALKLDWTVLYGKGTANMPRGVVNNPQINLFRTETGEVLARNAVVPDSDGAFFTYDNAIDMMGALEDNNVDIDSSFAFISAPAPFRELRKLKVDNYAGQTANQPYLVGLPTLTDAELRDLLGADFDKTTQIPINNQSGQSAGWTPAGAGVDTKYSDMFAANWSETLVGLWGGMSVTEDQGLSRFERDQVAIKMRLYADVGYRHEEATIWAPDVRAKN